MSACRRRKKHQCLLFVAATVGMSLALAGCDSQVKVHTNSPAATKRANANIHNRNRRQSQSSQPQVSLGVLPPLLLPEPQRTFALGAGDGLGRSVFAHYSEAPSQSDGITAKEKAASMLEAACSDE